MANHALTRKENVGIIMRPMVACTCVALVLMLLGLTGLGAFILDLTGHIEPGQTMADKMENGIAGMDLMHNLAYVCLGAGVFASLGVFLTRALKPRKHRA
ncbi:MAG: hypothetical protein AAF511_07395 [Pseudomonadota bacterium]